MSTTILSLTINHSISTPWINHSISTPWINHTLSTPWINHTLSTPSFNHQTKPASIMAGTSRFLALQREICRMIYEFVGPETTLRPIMAKKHGIYYEEPRPQTSLLLTNKHIYKEINSWFDTDTPFKIPVTIFGVHSYPYSHANASGIISMLRVCLKFEAMRKKSAPWTRSLSEKLLIEIPISVAKEVIPQADMLRLSDPVRWDQGLEEKLRGFLHVCLSRFRQGQSIGVQFLFPSGKGATRSDDSISLTGGQWWASEIQRWKQAWYSTLGLKVRPESDWPTLTAVLSVPRFYLEMDQVRSWLSELGNEWIWVHHTEEELKFLNKIEGRRYR